MPFDAYGGTISQIVARIVNNLTSLTNSPFTVVGTYGTTYKWYALMYNDPAGVSANNLYLIIGPHTMRATIATRSSGINNYSTCSTGCAADGRPYNYYGISFIVSSTFNPTNFTISSTSALWTYASVYLRYVVTYGVNATPCNDTTVPQTFEDMSATMYMHYDKYGFSLGIAGISQVGTVQPLQAFVQVRRIQPINPSIPLSHWWHVINDQRVWTTRLDTYCASNPVNVPYPANLCGDHPWTTSGTARGLCADAMTSYNMPPNLFTFFVSNNMYPGTFNNDLARREVRGCPQNGGLLNRCPVSFFYSFHTLITSGGYYGPYFFTIPSVKSSADGRGYIMRPVIGVNVKSGYTVYNVVPDIIVAQMDDMIPIPLSNDINDFDILQLSTGEQYIAISLNAPTTPITPATCAGYYDNIANVGAQRYLLRYD